MPPNNDKLSIDDEQWSSAVKRAAIARDLAEKQELGPDEVHYGCKALGISRAQLFRLVRRYKNDSRTSALLPRKRGRREGTFSLNGDTEEIINQAIQSYYLSEQKPTVSALHQIIVLECHKQNLPRPSRKAIDQRLKTIDLKILIGRRQGSKAADDKLRPVIESLQAHRPLQIVQVDHTKVDIVIVDEKYRQPIQRPWLTLLIDVATRVVAGYYLSLEAPSSTSVAMALQHAVLPKEKWLADLGISARWPVHGLPETLHMDNAKEFHARALRRGASEYGIRLQYRPIRTPHYGGHIERLIGTMMGEVHLLPGTTFSDVKERGNYDSERASRMTLKDLDRWLAIEIVGKYHQRIHSALGRPPIAVWNEMIAAGNMGLRLPSDQEHFYYDLLPYAERRIRRDGIHLFGIRYWDNVLTFWAGRSQNNFVVRYDPRNLSQVFLQSPEGEVWPIRYANSGAPPVTLWEYNAARKRLREQGQTEFDERMLFDAIEAQRLLVDEAARKTKVARRQQQRTAEALPSITTSSQQIQIIHAPAQREDEEIFKPYEIEEWS